MTDHTEIKAAASRLLTEMQLYDGPYTTTINIENDIKIVCNAVTALLAELDSVYKKYKAALEAVRSLVINDSLIHATNAEQYLSEQLNTLRIEKAEQESAQLKSKLEQALGCRSHKTEQWDR